LQVSIQVVNFHNPYFLEIFVLYFSKPANLDGLEVDQYIWSILEDPRTAESEEVTIDQYANMMPCTTSKVCSFKHDILYLSGSQTNAVFQKKIPGGER